MLTEETINSRERHNFSVSKGKVKTILISILLTANYVVSVWHFFFWVYYKKDTHAPEQYPLSHKKIQPHTPPKKNVLTKLDYKPIV